MIDTSFQAYLEDLLPLQGIESDNPDIESDELALTVVNRLTPKQRRQLLLKVIAAAFDSVRADRLRQAQEARLIDDKRRGNEIVTEAQPPAPTEMSDLLAALHRSVDAARSGGRKPDTLLAAGWKPPDQPDEET